MEVEHVRYVQRLLREPPAGLLEGMEGGELILTSLTFDAILTTNVA